MATAAGWKKNSGAGTGWAWDSRCRAQLGGEGSERMGVQETKAGVWGGVGVWECGGHSLELARRCSPRCMGQARELSTKTWAPGTGWLTR